MKLALGVAIIGMAGYGAVDSALVYMLKPLIDNGFGDKDLSVLRWMALAILGIVVIRGLCSFVSNYFMSWVGNNVVMRMQRNVFNHLVSMPVSYFDRQQTGRLLAKITYDSTQISSTASSTLVTLVREGCTIIGLLAVMIYQSWQLTLILFVVGPIVGVLIGIISRRFRVVSRRIQDAVGSITTVSEQMIKGHKEVLMFGGQKVEGDRFGEVSNHVRQQNMKLVAVNAIGTPIVQLIASCALSVLLFLASFPGIKEGLTAGAFAAVMTAMMAMLKPIRSITSINSEFQKGMAACQSLFDLLDSKLEPDPGKIEVEKAKGKVEFRNVSFSYPEGDRPALKNISFTMEPGQTVALVGRSGSGKTTIASLLTRFYNIEEGEILLDGVNLQDYKLKPLRRQMALVSQHVCLFNDSIAGNIAYAGEGEFNREQIEQAAESAYVNEFVSKMEQGLDTEIGENGASLSGGQRQRIAIARALLRESPVLILDEATSALDTESERFIQGALDNLQQGRSSLVIAHRLSTIENADLILVMDEGQIVEQGNHTELMAKSGAYAQLRTLQFGQQS